MYSFKIAIPIFHSQVILLCAESLEDCAKEGRVTYNLDINYSDGHLAVTENHGNTTSIAINLAAYNDDPSILVHETNHVAFAILRFIGDNPSSHNEEVICYLQQYIYKECKRLMDTIPQKCT